MTRSGVACFVFLGEELSDMTRILTRAFTHPWVASYQIGFGPPLVGSSPTLSTRLKYARSALDKLRAYLELCVFDEARCAQLASMQRRLLTRRLGPVEAEAVRRSSRDVLDLTLRLHHPERAPPDVATDMSACGVVAEDLPRDAPPDSQAARFWVHLDDPRSSRLLHDAEVARAVDDPDRALALELWVPAGLRGLFRIWGQALARDAELLVLDVGAPRSVARVSRDGRRS